MVFLFCFVRLWVCSRGGSGNVSVVNKSARTVAETNRAGLCLCPSLCLVYVTSATCVCTPLSMCPSAWMWSALHSPDRIAFRLLHGIGVHPSAAAVVMTHLPVLARLTFPFRCGEMVVRIEDSALHVRHRAFVRFVDSHVPGDVAFDAVVRRRSAPILSVGRWGSGLNPRASQEMSRHPVSLISFPPTQHSHLNPPPLRSIAINPPRPNHIHPNSITDVEIAFTSPLSPAPGSADRTSPTSC